MIKWIIHLWGCYSSEPAAGYGYGALNKKRNKPLEITKKEHWFYICDYCGCYVPDFKIRIKRRQISE